MKTTVEIDTDSPEELQQILQLSLETTDKVNYSLEAGDSLTVEIETDGLGPLRGCTDTVFRLTSLAEKI